MRRNNIALMLLVGVAGLAGTALANALAPVDDAADARADEAIVLLHGLGRSSRAMWALERRLSRAGYAVYNIDYSSTELPIDEIVEEVHAKLEACCLGKNARLHFVTHSLGGIVTRAYLAAYRPAELGRVVMLAPPNGGSEWVDWLRDRLVADRADPVDLFPPAMLELGTEQTSTPNRLGPAAFELGVITGSRSWHPFGSILMNGPSDGTVSVSSARVEGMDDFLVVPRSHSFIMFDRAVAGEILHFLRHGRFAEVDAPQSAPLGEALP